MVKPKNSVHKSGSAVPAFASGLGMTLEPIKAKTTNSSNDKVNYNFVIILILLLHVNYADVSIICKFKRFLGIMYAECPPLLSNL